MQAIKKIKLDEHWGLVFPLFIQGVVCTMGCFLGEDIFWKTKTIFSLQVFKKQQQKVFSEHF